MRGDFDKAHEQVEAISGTDLHTRAIALRGVIAAKRGDPSAFDAAVSALSDLPEPTDIALSTLLTAHGNLNAAVKALLRAQRTREPGLFLVAVDPLYVQLREQHADLALALQHARPAQCDRCAMPLQPGDVREVPECSLCGPCYLLLSTRN
jgi:hypothetical protein